VFVHGAITNGPASWSRQKPLAERWQLVVVNRAGFVPNPPAARADFDPDADDVAEVLAQVGPAHLVGHSYGGLIVLLAAARRPDLVRSLTAIEAAAFSLVRDDPEVEASIANHLSLVAAHGHDPREFLKHFTVSLGGDPSSVPDPLPDHLARHVALLVNERPPWEASIPVAELAAAPFPKLVLTGGHGEMQERMADTLAAALGPGVERDVLPGAGHAVQRTEEFNARLERFLATA
jgi:pimeloyl-ACP methyl ester carboxylesterase